MKQTRLTIFWIILSLILLLLTISYFSFSYFSHDFKRFGMLFNADSLYLPSLINNLMYERGAWNKWYLPPAPYFFPDMPLYFLSFGISTQVYIAQFFFALIQLCLIFISLYGINRLFFSKNQSLMYTAIVLAMLYLSVIGDQTIHAIISGHHFGTFLSILMGLYILVKYIQVEGYGVVKTTVLLLLISLTVASDKLFVIQFVIPVIVTVIILRFLKIISLRLFIRITTIALSGTVMGYLVYYLWVPNPTGFTPHFSLSNLTANLPTLYTLFYKTISNNIVYSLIFITFYSLILYKSALSLFTKTNSNSIITTTILLLASIFSINTFVIAISDLTINFRYFIPVFFMPLLFAPLLLFMLPSKSQWLVYIPRITMLLTVLLIAFNLFKKYTEYQLHSNYYPKAIQCFDNFIDQTRARSGIAHYWDAKRTVLLSQQTVTIAAYTPQIEPYNWISTSQWQQQRYDFALIRNQKYPQFQLDLELLKYYSPKQKISVSQCGLFDIYHFPNGLYTEPSI